MQNNALLLDPSSRPRPSQKKVRLPTQPTASAVIKTDKKYFTISGQTTAPLDPSDKDTVSIAFFLANYPASRPTWSLFLQKRQENISLRQVYTRAPPGERRGLAVFGPVVLALTGLSV